MFNFRLIRFIKLKNIMKESSNFEKYRAVISAMLINSVIGSYYMYGNINVYVAQYLISEGNEITEDSCLLINPVWLCVQSLSTAISMQIASKIGYRTLNFVTFMGYVLINFLTSYIKNYWVYIIVYGVGSGITIGTGYLLAIYITWTHFPGKKGFVTGLMLFAAGISATILSPLTTWIVNPDDLDPKDPKVIEKVPFMWRCLAVYYLVITLISCALLPKERITEEEKKRRQLLRKKAGKNGKEPLNDVSKEVEGSRKTFTRKNKTYGIFAGDTFNQEDRQFIEKLEISQGVQNENSIGILAQMNSNQISDLIRLSNRPQITSEKGNKNLEGIPEKSSSIDSSKKDFGFPNHKSEEIFKNQSSFNMSNEDIFRLSKEVRLVTCPSTGVAIKSKVFIMIFTMAFCSSIYNYFFNSIWKGYAIHRLNIPDSKMSVILSIAAIFSSLARLLQGILLMKFEFKPLYVIILILEIACAFTVEWLGGESYYIYLGYVCVAMFCLGSHVTLFPTMIQKVFGTEVGPKVYPLVYQGFSTASLLQYFLLKQLDGNYNFLFKVFGCMTIISLSLTIFFTDVKDWSKENKKYMKANGIKVNEIYGNEDK